MHLKHVKVRGQRLRQRQMSISLMAKDVLIVKIISGKAGNGQSFFILSLVYIIDCENSNLLSIKVVNRVLATFFYYLKKMVTSAKTLSFWVLAYPKALYRRAFSVPKHTIKIKRNTWFLRVRSQNLIC